MTIKTHSRENENAPIMEARPRDYKRPDHSVGELQPERATSAIGELSSTRTHGT
jgi:hypothetical protein